MYRFSSGQAAARAVAFEFGRRQHALEQQVGAGWASLPLAVKCGIARLVFNPGRNSPRDFATRAIAAQAAGRDPASAMVTSGESRGSQTAGRTASIRGAQGAHLSRAIFGNDICARSCRSKGQAKGNGDDCKTACGSGRVDACLLGRWQYVAGGMAAWMQRQTTVARFTEAARIEFRPDLTFAEGLDASVRAQRGSGAVDVATSGRWSAAGGVLTRCVDASTSSTRIHANGRVLNDPFRLPASSEQAAVKYSCRGDQLETSFHHPDTGTITTSYRRQPQAR